MLVVLVGHYDKNIGTIFHDKHLNFHKALLQVKAFYRPYDPSRVSSFTGMRMSMGEPKS